MRRCAEAAGRPIAGMRYFGRAGTDFRLHRREGDSDVENSRKACRRPPVTAPGRQLPGDTAAARSR